MTVMTSADIAELETLANDVRATRPHAARLLRRLLESVARPAEERLLTTTEAAKIMDVSDQTIRNWADAGWLPSHRAHRFARRMIPESALRAAQAFDATKLTPKRTMSDEDVAELVRKRRRERASA